ncbi:MAG TPA: hypothetical protein VF134_00345 [Candidatus Dormibacteraeota bacterium]
MTVLPYVLLLWIHVFCMAFWMGSMVFGLILGGADGVQQALTGDARTTRLLRRLPLAYGIAIPLGIVTGILLGTVFGPVRSLAALFTPYGLTMAAAFLLVAVAGAGGTAAAGFDAEPRAALARGRDRHPRRLHLHDADALRALTGPPYYRTLDPMAAFLANVGANASHRVQSPLHADGSFTLYPIPETIPWAPPMLRMPEIWKERAVHLDPDLTSPIPTYGDNCSTAGRAYSLRQARPGDLIAFVARLCPTDNSRPPNLHLVAALTIEDVKPNLLADPGAGWWDANAHIRRARATREHWNGFWVFRGDRERTGHLPKAVALDRRLAAELIPITWHPARTEQQTIASHTRAVRRLTGEPEALLRQLCPTSRS